MIDFYDYHAGVLEAWDGPALVAFADGRHLGACLDRNGLRPARYARTRSGLLALASEAGAVDLPGEEIVEKGRLGPGQMIAVDLEHGRLLRDDVVKTSVASRRPYGAWLLAQRRSLAPQRFDVGDEGGGRAPPAALRAARRPPPRPALASRTTCSSARRPPASPPRTSSSSSGPWRARPRSRASPWATTRRCRSSRASRTCSTTTSPSASPR